MTWRRASVVPVDTNSRKEEIMSFKLFSKEKEPQIEKLDIGKLKDMTKILKDMRKITDELLKQGNAGVLRTDYWGVVIDILVELHLPEMKNDPRMVQFIDKLTQYQNRSNKEKQ